MNAATRWVHEVARSPWLIVAGAAAGIGGFCFYAYEKLAATPSIYSILIGTLGGGVFLAGCVYSIRVRSENMALRRISATFCEINHIYRNTLCTLLGGAARPIRADLLQKELETLRSVCQRISAIFSRLIGRECVVTVKFLVPGEDGKLYAHTHVRSLENCERDHDGCRQYAVGMNENSGFYVAIQPRTDGLPSHFFSGDLVSLFRKGHYRNQRQNFWLYYKSTIVVPIQGRNVDRSGTPQEFDTIGYLCVDTKSRHRLNDSFHLHMMCSLAGQMYNFMSLMRGKYQTRRAQ